MADESFQFTPPRDPPKAPRPWGAVIAAITLVLAVILLLLIAATPWGGTMLYIVAQASRMFGHH